MDDNDDDDDDYYYYVPVDTGSLGDNGCECGTGQNRWSQKCLEPHAFLT